MKFFIDAIKLKPEEMTIRFTFALRDSSLSSLLMVPRARLVIEGRHLKYVLGIKTKTKGRRRVNTFVESQKHRLERRNLLKRNAGYKRVKKIT